MIKYEFLAHTNDKNGTETTHTYYNSIRLTILDQRAVRYVIKLQLTLVSINHVARSVDTVCVVIAACEKWQTLDASLALLFSLSPTPFLYSARLKQKYQRTREAHSVKLIRHEFAHSTSTCSLRITINSATLTRFDCCQSINDFCAHSHTRTNVNFIAHSNSVVVYQWDRKMYTQTKWCVKTCTEYFNWCFVCNMRLYWQVFWGRWRQRRQRRHHTFMWIEMKRLICALRMILIIFFSCSGFFVCFLFRLCLQIVCEWAIQFRFSCFYQWKIRRILDSIDKSMLICLGAKTYTHAALTLILSFQRKRSTGPIATNWVGMKWW